MKFVLTLMGLFILNLPAVAQDSAASQDDSSELKAEASPAPPSQDDPPKMVPGDPPKTAPSETEGAEDQQGDETLPSPKPAPLNFDLALMGEFVGNIDSEEEVVTMALQLRPVGGDEFDGLSYRGGLPGQEGCQLEAVTRYVGRRNEDVLILSGGKQAIFVRKEGCQLIGADGRSVGFLDRVERVSPTAGAVAPKDAIVIFDGSDTENLAPGQLTEKGTLRRGAIIAPMAQDFDLHVEFKLPLMVNDQGQKRGNSGVYLQSRYECQVLDSFATLPVFNSAGAIYRYKAADLSPSLPPTQWQTYDIRFTAPRWNSNGEKRRNARITSWFNGIKVQDDVEVTAKTGHGADEAPTLMPTKLQDHSDPVQYRNVWMIDRGLTPGIEFPVLADSPVEQSEQAEPVVDAEPVEEDVDDSSAE